MQKIAVFIFMLWTCCACDNPYENIREDQSYQGNPFVSLSSEQGIVALSEIFEDSILINEPQDHNLLVTLETVVKETSGEVSTNFRYETEVLIKAGKSSGIYTVEALTIPEESISKYKLSVRIASVDDTNIIAGLYGAKKENEKRVKRFKTYSFKK